MPLEISSTCRSLVGVKEDVMRTTRLQSLPVIGTLLLSACPPGLLVAQTVSPGDRVRVHLDEVQLVMSGADMKADTVIAIVDGSLVSWDSAGLVLQVRSAEEAAAIDTFLSWDGIDQLEQYAGQRSNMGTGALIGGLVGLAIGGAVALAACPCEVGTAGVLAGVGLVFVVPGVLIGGLLGAAAPADLWTQVPLQPDIPGPGRVDAEPTELPPAPESDLMEPTDTRQRVQLGLDFLYQDFGNMGSGPGVEGSFAVTARSGLRLGLGGELYFGNTTESFGEIVDWFAKGLFGELGYRFGHSRWTPYAGIRPELLWKEYDLPWEVDGETVIEHYTETEFAIGAVAGVETELSRYFGISFTGIFTVAERQNRIGLRIGARYLF
jgi:hypothetical protein